MKYEIPKEIKSKPKILGLEMRELVIILISSLLLLTILRELVHSLFTLFYFGVAVVAMIYLFLPSGNNPGKRNYESIVLMFRHKKGTYHTMDRNEVMNEQIQKGEKGWKEVNNKYGTFEIDKIGTGKTRL
ncbi:DUF5592 family protein [Virgibacillus indicus]|uniref:DUF5592 family protein n=1 Tax=Virgibacillus indicus TaxID=2024554 RepID=UPI0013FD585C|nr:DUF5592 family protein [Virgibacillus indicus]